MLAHVLGTGRLQVYLAHDRPLTEAEKQQLRGLVARRGRGEPLAYVLGDQDFLGHRLLVNRDVLIPRPETEGLAQRVLDGVPEARTGVDLGTGSGALAIALCAARPELRMLATDVSEAALSVARDNAARIGVADRLEFVRGSWWDPVPPGAQFEFVVSNPPYVDPAQPELLAEDVRQFEPATALFTPHGDPGAPYRAIAAGLVAHCRTGARVFLETGVGADQAALQALRDCPGVVEVELHPDDAGLPRYIHATVSGASPPVP